MLNFKGTHSSISQHLCVLIGWVLTLVSAHCLTDEPDLLVADFEGENWGGWKATGQAFGPGPAHGTLPNQMPVEGFLGKGLVNSFHGGDGNTGTLTSPPFRIERCYLRFLIGGGKHPGQTSINLLLDGQVVRAATGPNEKPGGSERLDGEQWDVSEFAGRMAIVQIVDQATGGWGHINIDQIVQTNLRLPGWIPNAQREFAVRKRYLLLPVKNTAPHRLVSVLLNGRLERQFDIELADDAPDWWGFMDLSPFQGKRLVLKLDKIQEDSKGLARIEQSDGLKGVEALYHERLRPQFHFSSRRGWNNDPNGLLYYAGQYHLFYQHNPYGCNWGNMHWGHAISRDLVHWRELADALYPDELGTIFSGSAVVDFNNTAGFKRGAAKPLICFYTAAGGTSPISQGRPFTQCLAYSLDHGCNWTKYDHNPVLPNIAGENRDPKVIWYGPEKKWVLALYLNGNTYGLFCSKNLKQWQKLSEVTIPGTSECPEFFEIPMSESRAESRWIFYGGDGRYLVGKFDGSNFTCESGPHSLNFGNCFYASQTFNNIPAQDGRRILIPWGTMATPDMPFNQMMGLPVELTLRTTGEGPRLCANPVRELERLRTKSRAVKPQPLGLGLNPLQDISGELLDIVATITVGSAVEVGFKLHGVPITYDVNRQELRCQGKKAPLKVSDGKITLRVLVDRTSIDIFGNQGRLYMPMGILVPQDNTSLEIYAKGSGASINSLRVHRMKSAWKL